MKMLDLGQHATQSDMAVARAIVKLGYYVTTEPDEQATTRHKVSVWESPARVRYVAGASKIGNWDELLRFILVRELRDKT